MPRYLNITSLAVYCTANLDKGDDEGFSALQFIKSLKGQPFKGHGTVPVDGRGYRIDSNSSDETVFDLFAQLAVQFVDPAPRWLVPVPSSKCADETSVIACRTFGMAKALANRSTYATPEALLWWTQPMQSAHKQGGPRDASVLKEWLVLKNLEDVDPAPIILVDDVYTTGGHLLACESFLYHQGFDVCGAICAGRANQSSKGAFEVDTREFLCVD